MRHISDKSNFLHTCNLLSQYLKDKGNLKGLNIEIGGKVESLEAIVKPGSSLSASTNTGKYDQQSLPEQQPSLMDSPTTVVEDASNEDTTSKGRITTKPKSSQLTIFYSGKVLVFDDYPADRTRELVSLAKTNSSEMSCSILHNAVPEKPHHTPREGLPPRPQSKQLVGISSNTCKAKTNPSVAVSISPPHQSSAGKQPVSITTKDRSNTGVAASSSGGGQKPHSPQSDANGSDLPIARRSSLHRFLEKRKDRAAVRGPYHNPEQPVSSSKDDEQIDLNL